MVKAKGKAGKSVQKCVGDPKVSTRFASGLLRLARILGFPSLALFFPVFIYACGGVDKPHDNENTGSIQQAATLTTPQVRIAGFEQLSDWSRVAGAGTLSLSTDKVEGTRALAITSTQSVAIQSVDFGTVSGGFRKIDLQLKLPSTTKAYLGSVQISLFSTTKPLNAVIGQAALSKAGGYSNYSFVVPAGVVTTLGTSHSDLRFVIKIETQVAAGILIDKLVLSGVATDAIAAPWGTGSPLPAGSSRLYASSDSAPTINSNANVSRTGAFVETIPLTVPPGRAGVQPRLTLSYDSSGPNGPVGIGWSVTGVSAIARCPSTAARDGVSMSVRVKKPAPNFCPDPALCQERFTEYNEGVDSFCLDGEKLVKTGGTNAAPEFRTERDSFTKVTTSYGGANWPAVFKVYTKDGNIHTYEAGRVGTGWDHYDEATGLPVNGQFQGVLSWHLSRTEDRFGNAISYSYQEGGPVNGGIQQQSTYELIKQIDYTTCAPGSACPYGGATNRIRFEYEDRPDIVGGYTGGLPSSLGKRLKRIRTEYKKPSGSFATAQVHILSYDQSGATGRSRLTQVQECPLPPGEGEGTTCRPPMTFTWGAGQGDLFRRRYQIFTPYGAPATRPSWECRAPVSPSNPQPGCIWVDYKSFGSSFPNPKIEWGDGMLMLGDFDGNGSDDIVYGLTSRWDTSGPIPDASRLVLTQRTGLTKDVTFTMKSISSAMAFNYRNPVDIDQDGQTELFRQQFQSNPTNPNLENFKLARLSPTTFQFEHVQVNGADYVLQGGYYSPPSFLDVTGDGFLDHYYDDLVQNVESTVSFKGKYYLRVGQPTGVGSVPSFGPAQVAYTVGSGYPNNAEPVSRFKRCEFRGLSLAAGDPKTFYRHCDDPAYADWNRYVDVNGDGNADGLELIGGKIAPRGRIREGTGVALSLATGSQPEDQMKPPYTAGPSSMFETPEAEMVDQGYLPHADIDGDGLTDFVKAATPGTRLLSTVFADEPPVVWLSRNKRDLGPANCGTDASPCKVTQFEPITLPYAGRRLFPIRTADFNGDGLSDFVQYVDLVSSPTEYSYRLEFIVQDPSNRDDVITAVNDGKQYGTITYYSGPTALVDTNASSVLPTCSGQHCLRKAANMVMQTNLTQKGVSEHKRYYYEGPTADVSGRGFIGYGAVAEWNVTRAQSLLTTYAVATIDGSATGKHSYPYAGTPSVQQWRSGPDVPTLYPNLLGGSNQPLAGPLVNRTSTSIFTNQIHRTNASKTYFVETSVKRVIDTGDGGNFRDSSVTSTYDDYGNLKTQTFSVLNGEKVETTNTYTNDTSSWLLGQLTDISTKSTRNSETSLPRLVKRTYGAQGALATDTVQPGDATLESITTLSRDAAGLVRSAVSRDKFGNVRTSVTDYNAAGIFVEHTQNGAGHDEWFVYDAVNGKLLVRYDAGGRRSDYAWDHYDRLVMTKEAGTAPVWLDYSVSTTYAGGLRVTKKVGGTSFSNAIASETFDYNPLGRLGKATWTVDNPSTPNVQTFYDYDSVGRLIATYTPSFVGQYPPATTRYQYDNLGTMRLRNDADGARLEVSYITPLQRQIVRTTSGFSSTTLVTSAPDGVVTSSVQSASEGTRGLTSVYGPWRLLKKVTEDTGPSKEYQYNVLGRPSLVTTPEAGQTELKYTGFGEVNRIRRLATSPISVTDFVFDAVGRLVRETTDSLVTSYAYDLHGSNGAQRLGYSVSPDGVFELNTYDSSGRLDKRTIGDSAAEYTYGHSYDGMGRLSQLDYPETPGLARMQLRHEYDAVNGSLDRIYNVADGSEWFSNTSRDVLGRPLVDKIVNTFTESRELDPVTLLPTRIVVTPYIGAALYDVNYRYLSGGNPSLREEKADLKVDEYYYNGFNELKTWVARENGIPTSKTYTYDKLGNATGTTDGTVMRMFGTGNQAHQLLNQPNVGWSFTYDKLGRQTDKHRFGLLVRHVDYTPFDLPKTIVNQPVPGTSSTINFKYSPSQQRFSKSDGTNTTNYVSELYERRVAGANVKHIQYVWADGRRIGQRTYDQTAGTYRDVPYLSDAQGSVTVAWTTGGANRVWYSPWGEKFKSGRTTMANVTVGFTGHEQDDEAGLINMRGRMYDPTTSSFLSPDPILTKPHLASSHNPYVYVRNNPVIYSDPSGFETQTGHTSYGTGWSTTNDSRGGFVTFDDDRLSASLASRGASPYANSSGSSFTPGYSEGNTPRPSGTGASPTQSPIWHTLTDREKVESLLADSPNGCGSSAMSCPGLSVPDNQSYRFDIDEYTRRFDERETELNRIESAIRADAMQPTLSPVDFIPWARIAKASVAVVEANAARGGLGVGGNIRYVNPTGGTMNCANCAIATDATLAGSPASALPGGVTSAAGLAKELGGTWVRTTGPGGIAQTMQAAGPGARGIVFGTRGSGVGHFFNVTNQGGVVRFLDGQAGGAANLAAGYDGFWLIRTF